MAVGTATRFRGLLPCCRSRMALTRRLWECECAAALLVAPVYWSHRMLTRASVVLVAGSKWLRASVAGACPLVEVARFVYEVHGGVCGRFRLRMGLGLIGGGGIGEMGPRLFLGQCGESGPLETFWIRDDYGVGAWRGRGAGELFGPGGEDVFQGAALHQSAEIFLDDLDDLVLADTGDLDRVGDGCGR